MTEKSGWKKKRILSKGENKDLDVFRATSLDTDFNYKNIQLPQDSTPIIEGYDTGTSASTSADDPNEKNLNSHESGAGTSTSTRPGPGPGLVDDSDDIEIPEWKMPDSPFIPKVPEKITDHPGIWAFSRLLNRIIDQLNWFLKYIYGAVEATKQSEPNALAVLWAIILAVIMLVVQVIFLIPNIISYFSEFIGICFAVILFELIAPGEDKEKYRQGIHASIEGTTGMIGTCVAFLVTLNLWYAIAQRESETDVVSMLEKILSKPLFGFFRHGLAGALMLYHMFGRMKMGKPMQSDEGGGGGGAGANLMSMASSVMLSGTPSTGTDSTAKQYEKLVNKIKDNPTISFIVLFSIILSSFAGGAFDKLMNSQNTIKAAMGDGSGSPVWYIIVIFCMVASAVSFLSALPSSFTIAAPLLSGFYILMLLIATLVTFQLGSIGAIMIMFYFMFMVIPVEEFGAWKTSVSIIFNSFKLNNTNAGKFKKIFLNYGVIFVFALAIMGSFTRMMADVSKSLPAKLSGGLFGIGGAGLIATFLVLYKFVFPENIAELIKEFFPEA